MSDIIDVSIVVTAHSEGIILHKTLLSIDLARKYASEFGIKTELILIGDNLDSSTMDYLNKNSDTFNLELFKVEFADAVLSRNYGIEKSKGKYVLIIDGDDIINSKFIESLYKKADTENNKKLVLVPETSHVFGGQYLLNFNKDFSTPEIKNIVLEYNPYNCVIFFNLEQFREDKIKYLKCSSNDGYAYEDLAIICDLVYKNYEFKVTSGANLFVRRKSIGQSRLVQQNDSINVLPRLDLFEKENIEIIKYENLNNNSTEIKESTKNFTKRVIKKLLKIALDRYRKIDVKKRQDLQKMAIFRTLKKIFLRNTGVDLDKLKKIVKELNTIEPEINLRLYRAEGFNSYKVPDYSLVNKSYLEFCNKSNYDNYDYLVFLPWVKPGGADKVAVNLINTLLSNDNNIKILIILTEIGSKNEWLDRIDKRADILSLNSSLSREQSFQLISRIILQFEVNKIIIINSSLAFDYLINSSNLIKNRTIKVFAFAFCDDYDSDKMLAGYPNIYVPKAYYQIDKIVGDNSSYLEFLSNQYGFDQDKLVCLYQPFSFDKELLATKSVVDNKNKSKSILWANRIDTQKRPEVIVAIAKELKRRGRQDISIDVYGEPLLGIEGSDYLAQIKEQANISYKGGFNGFSNIPKIEDYSCFIYTSSHDGIPNVLLEAMSEKMLVLSTNVGGIGEVIESGINGFLIDDNNLIDNFADKIIEIVDNSSKFNDFGELAYQKIAKQHDWHKYSEKVKSIF